jgi:hypothetical protein
LIQHAIWDCNTTCPVAITGGGKNDIPNRLKRQFALFNVPLPSVAAINGIFGRLVEGRFSSDVFSDEVDEGACHHKSRISVSGHVTASRNKLHPPCNVCTLCHQQDSPPASKGLSREVAHIFLRMQLVLMCTQVVFVASKLVPLTITLWNKTQTKMLPTPAKFHYLFNMRELSKVFQVSQSCAAGKTPAE